MKNKIINQSIDNDNIERLKNRNRKIKTEEIAKKKKKVVARNVRNIMFCT